MGLTGQLEGALYKAGFLGCRAKTQRTHPATHLFRGGLRLFTKVCVDVNHFTPGKKSSLYMFGIVKA
jgi:hypothetical protein